MDLCKEWIADIETYYNVSTLGYPIMVDKVREDSIELSIQDPAERDKFGRCPAGRAVS